MDEILKQILNELTAIRKDIAEIKEGQQQLRKDVIGSLGSFTEKIADDVNDKTGALNKRVYGLEVDIQRLTRQ